MSAVNVLAVMAEAIRRAEESMPTPFGLRGESASHPVHVAGFIHDLKQARYAVAEFIAAETEVDLANDELSIAEAADPGERHREWAARREACGVRVDAAERRRDAALARIGGAA